MGLKNKEVIITRLARTSIREIYEYIKNRERSVSIAQYVRESIINKCLSLKDFSGYSKESYLEEYPEDYRSIMPLHSGDLTYALDIPRPRNFISFIKSAESYCEP